MPILKKIFFFCLFIFFFSLLLWGVYMISFKKNAANNSEKANGMPPSVINSLPKADTGKISAVIDEPVLSAAIFADKIRYFSKSTKEAYESDFNGEDKNNLGSGKNMNIQDAFWSSDGQRAILKLKDTYGNISYAVYDFERNIQTPIKKSMEDVYWQEGGNRIFYKYYDAKNKTRSLNVSDSDGSNWKKLADLPFRYMAAASIPRSGLLSFWNTGEAWDETVFSSVPVIGGEIKSIMKGKFGADYLWNKDGTYALMSHVNTRGGNQMQLAVLNSNGGEYKNLDIPTFVSKCAWSKDGKTVYYALPGNIPQNSVLPDEYKSHKFETTDTFWKVDVFTGEKTRLVEPNEIKKKFDANKLFLNSDESLIFFTNRADGKLYKISL